MSARYLPGPAVRSLDRLADLLDTVGLVFMGSGSGKQKIQNRKWLENMTWSTVRGYVAGGFIREALDLEDPPSWLANWIQKEA